VDIYEEGQGNPKLEATIEPKRLRSLFRLANYYHHFIQEFSKVVRTLSGLLRKIGIPKMR
jgi:hypothetical protein